MSNLPAGVIALTPYPVHAPTAPAAPHAAAPAVMPPVRHTAVDAPSAAPKIPDAETLLKVVESLQKVSTEIAALRNGEQFLNTLVASLSTYPPFIGLIRSLMLDQIAGTTAAADATAPAPIGQLADLGATTQSSMEFVSDQHRLAAPAAPQYHVELSQSRDPAKHRLRVALLSNQHPTRPGGLEAYLDESEDITNPHWHEVQVNPDVFPIVHKQLTDLGAGPGDFYWVFIALLSDQPTGKAYL